MSAVATPNTQTIGRGTPYRGKLVALPTTNKFLQKISSSANTNTGNSSSSFWSTSNQGLTIEFPAHPKTIELARSATYIVQTSPFLPDGYHQYVATNPLEIPISFELHSFDRTYCKQGALTLLQIASRLHGFILPISDGQTLSQVAPAVSSGGQGTQASLNGNSATANVNYTAYGQQGKSSLNPPVTCWLHLIWIDSNSPGISCVGYLKDVKVALGGPLLKGPNGSFNLPTSAEFSFTFVHHPAHNNTFGDIGNPNSAVTIPPSAATGAFASTVRDRFYNTRDLVQVANYQGLEDASTNTTPDTTNPTVDQTGETIPPLQTPSEINMATANRINVANSDVPLGQVPVTGITARETATARIVTLPPQN